MQRAITQLPRHDQRYKHWSFIVQRNKIIDCGSNMTHEPPLHFGYGRRIDGNVPKLHSEIVAWRKCKGILDKSLGFEVINIRLNSIGEWRNSMPCEVCQDLLTAFGCYRVWFTANDGWKSMDLQEL